jgi:hypothetical protein
MSGEPEWYLFLAAVRSRSRRPDPKWIDALRANLTDAGWRGCLDPSGELRDYRDHPIGRYRLADADEVRARWGDAPWFDLAPPCPHVGPVTGFLNWESWMDTKTGRDFAADLLWATRGYLARTDSDARFEGVVEERFPLREAASSSGFHDGDFFFRDDAAYGGYVRSEIVAAVERLGLQPELFNGGTSHNPHRINQFVPRQNMPYAAAWQKFRDHENLPLQLWGYNRAGMTSPAFADFLAPDDGG